MTESSQQQAESISKPPPGTAAPAGWNASPLVAAALVGALVLGLGLAPEPWQLALRYERAPLMAGEWWRALTGHFVHLSWGHLLLNLAALGALAWIFMHEVGAARLLLAIVAAALACSAGLAIFNPDLAWCVGLSGVLHGVFVYGALEWMFRGIGLGKWLLAGVAAKLAYEQFVGEVPMTSALVGGDVITDAHLWGALGGVLAAALTRGWAARAQRV